MQEMRFNDAQSSEQQSQAGLTQPKCWAESVNLRNKHLRRHWMTDVIRMAHAVRQYHLIVVDLGIGHLAKQVRNAIEAGFLLIHRLYNPPRCLWNVSALQHYLFGLGVLLPADSALQIHGAQLPLPAHVEGSKPSNNDEWLLDSDSFQATWRGQALPLTRREFTLLRILRSKPGKIYSRSQLLDLAYADTLDVSDRAIDSHIKNLRKKLHAAMGEGTDCIRSVYGVGFVFEEPAESL